jgi:hypothetical protein
MRMPRFYNESRWGTSVCRRVIWCAPVVLKLRVLAVLAVALATAVAASGCVVVKAHQRENLAKRSMTSDRDTGETRFAAHQTSAREGAEGGTGQPGGGCGCN